MWEKFHAFMTDKANSGLLKNGAKTALWLLAFLNSDHISNTIRTACHDIRGSQGVRELWDGFVKELRRVRSRVYRVVVYAALGWFASFALVGLKNPNSVAVGLGFALLPQALLFGLAVRATVWIEAYRAIKHQIGYLLRGVNSALPDIVQLRPIPIHDEGTIGSEDLYRMPYKAVFWLGVMHFAIALTAMVSGGDGKPVPASAMAAAQILLIVNIGVAGAGYVLGYGTRSALYRKLAIIVMVLAPIVGLLKVAYTSYHEQEAKAIEAVVKAEAKTKEALDKELAVIDKDIKDLVGTGSPNPDTRKTIAWKQEVRAWAEGGKNGAMPMRPLYSCEDGEDNNGDGEVDADDRSCGRPDKSCVTGQAINYVKGPDGKPLKDEKGKKVVASRKPVYADDCRIFEGEDIARRYDPKRSEVKMPKPEKPATASSGNGNRQRADKDKEEKPRPVASRGSAASRAAISTLAEMGWQ